MLIARLELNLQKILIFYDLPHKKKEGKKKKKGRPNSKQHEMDHSPQTSAKLGRCNVVNST